MEVIPAYEKLLREDKTFIASLEKKYEPACSGIVLDLGLDCQYPQLAHHNFFFSGHQQEHFAKGMRPVSAELLAGGSERVVAPL